MIWFDRRMARGLTAAFELRVRLLRGRRTLPFTVRIEDGRMRVRPGRARTAAVTVTIGALDLVRLGLGKARWPQLISSGRLELGGDPFLALRFPSLFRLRAR